MKPGERLVPVRPIDHQAGDAGARRSSRGLPMLRRSTSTCAASSKTFSQRSTGLLGQRKGASFRAVDDVSFSIPRGECFGLVGESGCGKTTLSKIIMRALDAGRAARSSTTTAARCSTSRTPMATS